MHEILDCMHLLMRSPTLGLKTRAVVSTETNTVPSLLSKSGSRYPRAPLLLLLPLLLPLLLLLTVAGRVSVKASQTPSSSGTNLKNQAPGNVYKRLPPACSMRQQPAKAQNKRPNKTAAGLAAASGPFSDSVPYLKRKPRRCLYTPRRATCQKEGGSIAVPLQQQQQQHMHVPTSGTAARKATEASAWGGLALNKPQYFSSDKLDEQI